MGDGIYILSKVFHMIITCHLGWALLSSGSLYGIGGVKAAERSFSKG